MSPDQITECLAMALKHQGAGPPDKAARLCLQVLKEEPASPEAIHLLGVLALQKGEVDRALGLLSDAVTLAPDDDAVLLSLGLAHRRKGVLEQAEICVRRALALAPDSADMLVQPGLMPEQASLQVSLEALPHLLELCSPEDVPRPPYLIPDDKLAMPWSARLAGDEAFKICLMWKGEQDSGDPLQ